MNTLPMTSSSSISTQEQCYLSFSLEDSIFYFEDLMGSKLQDPLVITVNEALNPSFEVLFIQNDQKSNRLLKLVDPSRETKIKQLLESIEAFQKIDSSKL